MKKQNWETIENNLRKEFPNLNIVIDKTSYKGSRSKIKMFVNGKEFWILYQNLRDGRIKFKNFNTNWSNPQKNSFSYMEDKILKATIKKFPEFKNKINIKVIDYINADEEMTIEYNGKKKTQNASTLLSHGLTANDLQIKRKAYFKHKAEDILRKIKEKYPYLSFLLADYIDFKTRISFHDEIYGEWKAIPYEVLKGIQHPKRAIEKRKKIQFIGYDEVVKRIKEGYTNDKENIPARDYLTMDKDSYVDTRTKCKFFDKEYGEFFAIPNHVIFGQEHPTRSKKGSKYELEIQLWLESFDVFVERNVRLNYNGIIREIDVYIPDKNIGIEINGLYWHTQDKKGKTYHIEKREMMNSLGIKLLQITDEEWLYKKNIVKSLILSNLGISTNKIMARKCELKKITQKEAKVFLDENHLMGFTQASFLALFYGNEIVSLLSYHHKKDGSEIDISRFCNKKGFVVVGGLSKLINAIPKKQAKYIVSWVDLRYGDGHSLKTLGFSLERITLGFRWTDHSQTFNRRYVRANMDERKLSENDYANEMKLFKIYDAGQALFSKKI